MPTFRIESPDGRTFDVTGPEGSTKEQALARVKAQGGGASAAPKAPEKAPEQYGPARSQEDGIITGAVKDTLGMTGRGVPLTGTKDVKTPLGVILKPDNALEFGVREAVLAPATAASLPVRIAASAGIGSLDALASGKGFDGAAYEGLLDAITAGVTEAVFGKGAKLVSKVSAPMRGLEWATRAPREALDALAARLPKGKFMNVPSIAGGKMTAEEAIDELVKLRGAEYKQARDEIASELSRLDKQRVTGPKPVAGTVFKQRTEPEIFESRRSPTLMHAAENTAKAMRAPLTRSAADVAATTPIPEGDGLPFGAIPILAAVEKSGNAWDWLKGLGNRVIAK